MPVEWIALNAVEGLGPVGFKRLLDCFGSPAEVLRRPLDDLVRLANIDRSVASRITSPALLDQAATQLESCRAKGVTVMTRADPHYPVLLGEIFAPPPVLFIRGNADLFSRNAIGIVGTRTPTPYGRRATAALGRDLIAAGLTIVSGLAMGIDAIAHQTALDSNGTTIAVLGSGVDLVYPATNRKLADRILTHGALVSEFPLGTRPLRYNFPRRNRIISGLSAGVVVVEAGRKSGSLITANYALQQGREVFAVPGSVFSDMSEGTFNLIRNGATPVRSASEITEAIGTLTHSLFPTRSATTAFPPELLTESERRVVQALSHSPRRLDELAESLDFSLNELHALLLSLELKGAIRQLAGQQFVREGSLPTPP